MTTILNNIQNMITFQFLKLASYMVYRATLKNLMILGQIKNEISDFISEATHELA